MKSLKQTLLVGLILGCMSLAGVIPMCIRYSDNVYSKEYIEGKLFGKVDAGIIDMLLSQIEILQMLIWLFLFLGMALIIISLLSLVLLHKTTMPQANHSTDEPQVY